MRSGAEIESELRAFVKRWKGYAGSERSEAQTFLNDLFAAFGTDRKAVGALFEDFKSSAGFMDLHWPGELIVEMKKPGIPLAKADDQRIRYWQESSNAAEGGFQDLKALHKTLDEAVADAYGWPKAAAQDAAELVRRLRELNRERAQAS